MKFTKLEKDFQTLFYLMTNNQDFKSVTYHYFETEYKKNELFNIIYNNHTTTDISEYEAKKVIKTYSYGKELFGLKVYQFDDAIYMLKGTHKTKQVLAIFEKKVG